MIRYYVKITDLKPTYTGGQPLESYTSADSEEALRAILRKEFSVKFKDDFHVQVIGAEILNED